MVARCTRRQATHRRAARCRPHRIPYGVNGGQIVAPRARPGGLAALGQQIATACYPDVASLRAGRRGPVRAPAASGSRSPRSSRLRTDWGRPATALQSVADTLATKVGDDAEGLGPELDAMNQALAGADSVIGRPPMLTGAPADINAPSEPAWDLDPTRAALTRGPHDARKAPPSGPGLGPGPRQRPPSPPCGPDPVLGDTSRRRWLPVG